MKAKRKLWAVEVPGFPSAYVMVASDRIARVRVSKDAAWLSAVADDTETQKSVREAAMRRLRRLGKVRRKNQGGN